MTDAMPTRREIHDAITEKWGAMPQSVDHNGRSANEKAREAAGIAAYLDAGTYAHLEEPPAPQVGMKPNRAQGHGGSPVSPTGSGGTLADRMRANAQAALDAGPGAA